MKYWNVILYNLNRYFMYFLIFALLRRLSDENLNEEGRIFFKFWMTTGVLIIIYANIVIFLSKKVLFREYYTFVFGGLLFTIVLFELVLLK